MVLDIHTSQACIVYLTVMFTRACAEIGGLEESVTVTNVKRVEPMVVAEHCTLIAPVGLSNEKPSGGGGSGSALKVRGLRTLPWMVIFGATMTSLPGLLVQSTESPYSSWIEPTADFTGITKLISLVRKLLAVVKDGLSLIVMEPVNTPPVSRITPNS
jgi:hypothetical protein